MSRGSRVWGSAARDSCSSDSEDKEARQGESDAGQGASPDEGELGLAAPAEGHAVLDAIEDRRRHGTGLRGSRANVQLALTRPS